jgi:hypothetical protein
MKDKKWLNVSEHPFEVIKGDYCRLKRYDNIIQLIHDEVTEGRKLCQTRMKQMLKES